MIREKPTKRPKAGDGFAWSRRHEGGVVCWALIWQIGAMAFGTTRVIGESAQPHIAAAQLRQARTWLRQVTHTHIERNSR